MKKQGFELVGKVVLMIKNHQHQLEIGFGK